MNPYSESLRAALPPCAAGVQYDARPVARTNAPALAGQRKQEVQVSPFAQVLQEKLGAADVVLSGHATERLKTRGIVQTPQMMRELGRAVNQLAQKGGRDSLVVMGDVGFVVNVPNRTVVTALAMAGAESQVFTNIDSAIWVQAPVR